MGFDRAVVADGGVPPEEVDMKTMRSKRVPNLFITGDLLHITRPQLLPQSRFWRALQLLVVVVLTMRSFIRTMRLGITTARRRAR
jgi:hypothetical protein